MSPTKDNLNFHFWAMAALGRGLSGSDRIFIELARRWGKNYPVKIYVWEEGYQMCQRQHLQVSGIKYQVSSMEPWRRFGFAINYFARIVESIKIALSLKLENKAQTMVYSASEFWMDSLPALTLKLRYPKITWVAAWYQTAPKPWIGYTLGERVNTYKFSAFLYWFVQQPIKPLILRFADFVFVNNEEEKKQFPNLNKRRRALVVLGAVDLEKIGNWKLVLNNRLRRGNLPKVYDAVFQGRFHPQKGVVELIDIWKRVVDKRPDARLAMIGDGPLMESVKLKVKSEKLEKNIELFGYLFDGPKKYKIFAQSKIVVHPAFYDSGGMAAAEAMAFGLPCVGFNLKAYNSYYPEGMIKVDVGNLELFSEAVFELLTNDKKRNILGQEALNMINSSWSWRERADGLLNQLIK